MALPPMTPRSVKQYILAGLTATIAAAVVVTVFFVVLSPARITFSVTKACSRRAGNGVELVLTLAANNTSQRAAVKYQILFVDVSNNTGPELVSWVRAKLNTTDKPQWHPHGRVATVDATATLLWGTLTTAFFGDGAAAAPLVVVVTAGARFKVAGIHTKLYDITVRCGPLTFVCQSCTASSSAAPPVGCSPV